MFFFVSSRWWFGRTLLYYNTLVNFSNDDSTFLQHFGTLVIWYEFWDLEIGCGLEMLNEARIRSNWRCWVTVVASKRSIRPKKDEKDDQTTNQIHRFSLPISNPRWLHTWTIPGCCRVNEFFQLYQNDRCPFNQHRWCCANLPGQFIHRTIDKMIQPFHSLRKIPFDAPENHQGWEQCGVWWE